MAAAFFVIEFFPDFVNIHSFVMPICKVINTVRPKSFHRKCGWSCKSMEATKCSRSE